MKSGDDSLELRKNLLSRGYHVYELSEGNAKLISDTGERLCTRMRRGLSVEFRGFI